MYQRAILRLASQYPTGLQPVPEAGDLYVSHVLLREVFRAADVRFVRSVSRPSSLPIRRFRATTTSRDAPTRPSFVPLLQRPGCRVPIRSVTTTSIWTTRDTAFAARPPKISSARSISRSIRPRAPIKACGGTVLPAPKRAGASTSLTRATRSSPPGTPTSTTGKALWLSMLAPALRHQQRLRRATSMSTSGRLSTTSSSPVTPQQVGTGTVTFADANNATFAYQVTQAARQHHQRRRSPGTISARRAAHLHLLPHQSEFLGRDQLPGPLVGP